MLNATQFQFPRLQLARVKQMRCYWGYKTYCTSDLDLAERHYSLHWQFDHDHDHVRAWKSSLRQLCVAYPLHYLEEGFLLAESGRLTLSLSLIRNNLSPAQQ
jgi:hypothetical protein